MFSPFRLQAKPYRRIRRKFDENRQNPFNAKDIRSVTYGFTAGA
jgi:hypothetical protein